MRKCTRSALLLMVYLTIFNSMILNGQSKVIDYPVIGAHSPEFVLNDVVHFKSKRASLQDFKGKWLVLDFWTKTCSICISSFPKLNELQQEFKGLVQFVLIGNNGGKHNQGIEKMFERIYKLQRLDLPAAFDSLLFDRFSIRSTPHIVVIDPGGIVRAVISAAHLNSGNLKALIARKNVHLEQKLNGEEQDSSSKNTYTRLSPGTLNSELINASVLSRWDKSLPMWSVWEIDANLKEGSYKTTGMTLERLYNVAYLGKTDWNYTDSLYGKFWRMPLFKFPAGSLRYNYELKVNHPASKLHMQLMMQHDLRKSFGYKVQLRKKKMPCWKLHARGKALKNLKTKGGATSRHRDHSGFSYTNVSLDYVLTIMNGYHPSVDPIVSCTGINGNIDLQITADLTNFKDIQHAFLEQGLVFKPGRRKMGVIVVKKQ